MKNRLFIIFLAAFAISLLYQGCELNDWDVVLTPPSPLTNVSVTNMSESDGYTDRMTITVQFTIPNQREWEIFPDHNFDVFFHYRKTDISAESAQLVFERNYIVTLDMINTVQSSDFQIAKSELTNGDEYIITASLAGGEGKISEPIDADPIVISW